MLANQLSPPDTRPPSNQRLLSARFKKAIVIFFHIMLKNYFEKTIDHFCSVSTHIYTVHYPCFNDGTTFTWPHLSEVSLITKRFSSHIKSKYNSNVMVSSMSLIFDTSNMNISTKISNGPSVVGIMSWNNTINLICVKCVWPSNTI